MGSVPKIMSVAVVIPTYGHIDYIYRAITSLAASLDEVMIIVVDDGTEPWPGDDVVGGWCGHHAHVVHRRTHDGNLSKSWNQGARIAQVYGAQSVVFGNSDLVFPRGWWAPLEQGIQCGASIVGPLTNAPGHVRAQWIGHYLPYAVDDDMDAIQDVQDRLRLIDRKVILGQVLNGFCFAVDGKWLTEFGWAPFRESIPMAGNEVEFISRSIVRNAQVVIAPQSFVFHYRSVSRGLKTPRLDSGFVRIPGCTGCQGREKRE